MDCGAWEVPRLLFFAGIDRSFGAQRRRRRFLLEEGRLDRFLRFPRLLRSLCVHNHVPLAYSTVWADRPTHTVRLIIMLFVFVPFFPPHIPR